MEGCRSTPTNVISSSVEDVQIQNYPLSSFVSQIVAYLGQVLAKRVTAEKSQSSHLLFVKIGSQAVEYTGNQIWCTVKVGSKHLNHLDLHIDEFLQVCHRQFVTSIKDMQDQFGGEHLWCEYPNNTAQETSSCRRAQWKVGPPGSHPLCRFADRPKLINTCSVCFRILQDTHHVIEECRHIENFLHKTGIVNPQVKMKFTCEVGGEGVTYDFGPHSPRLCIGQKKILCDIRHFTRIIADSPTSKGKIFPRCGVPYNIQQLSVNNVREKVQLKVHAVSGLIPPKPINTTLLNHTVKKLQVVFYGPGDTPVCNSNKAQLGLCPTTLVRLEEYGLKIGERLTQDEFVTGQGYVHCDWSFKLDVMDIAMSNEELDTERREDDATLLVIVFINATDKKRYSSLDNIQLLDHIQNNFAQIICKNKAKVRKAVGTSLNKILHNFSAHDQRQKLLDTSIPLIASALSSIVTHSTDVNFRSDVYRLLEVTDTRAYKRDLKCSLWKIANETYTVIMPETASSSGKKDHQSKEPPPGTNTQQAAVVTHGSVSASTQNHNSNTKERQPQFIDTDFDDLGTEPVPNIDRVTENKASEHLSNATNSTLSTTRSQPNINDYKSVPVSRSHTARRRLSKEFESHVLVEKSAGPNVSSTSSAENPIGNFKDTDALKVDHFEFLGEDQVSLTDAVRTFNELDTIVSSDLPSSLLPATSVEGTEVQVPFLQMPPEDWWDNVSWT